jgi:hypothetical protein
MKKINFYYQYYKPKKKEMRIILIYPTFLAEAAQFWSVQRICGPQIRSDWLRTSEILSEQSHSKIQAIHCTDEVNNV